MFKKLLLVGVIAAVAVVGLRGTKFFGYAKQEVASWREAIDDQIPVEKKIAQMRKDVGALDKDIEKVKTELATAIVRVRDLTGETADMRVAVDAEQKAILARGEALKNALDGKPEKDGTVKVNAVSAAEAKDRLRRDVNLLKAKRTHLEGLEKALAQQERAKEILEKQFDEMRRQKEELKVQIDAVEAEYKALQLQQMESKYQTDDTRLAKIKESLRSLRNKLDVEKEKLNLTPKVHEAPVTSTTSAESVDDILAPLTK